MPEVYSYLAAFTDGRASALVETEIQDHIMARLVNEAPMCLQTNVACNPMEGNIRLVFSTRFMPFKEGPWYHAVHTLNAEGRGDWEA